MCQYIGSIAKLSLSHKYQINTVATGVAATGVAATSVAATGVVATSVTAAASGCSGSGDSGDLTILGDRTLSEITIRDVESGASRI